MSSLATNIWEADDVRRPWSGHSGSADSKGLLKDRWLKGSAFVKVKDVPASVCPAHLSRSASLRDRCLSEWRSVLAEVDQCVPAVARLRLSPCRDSPPPRWTSVGFRARPSGVNPPAVIVHLLVWFQMCTICCVLRTRSIVSKVRSRRCASHRCGLGFLKSENVRVS